jgi:hypothetical protein
VALNKKLLAEKLEKAQGQAKRGIVAAIAMVEDGQSLKSSEPCQKDQ